MKSNPSNLMQQEPTNIDEILLAPFLYGIQSELIHDKDELNHRIAAFKANNWFKEPKQQLLSTMLELVGDMEQRETEDMTLKSWTPEDYKAFGRNELRAEIISKLNKAMK